MNTFFGLDFGTSNSALSVNVSGKVNLLEIDKVNQNPFILKSVLYFDEEKQIFNFGQNAVDAYMKEDAEGRYIQSIKSFLPDRFFISTVIEGLIFEISDLIAMIIEEIKKRGENIIGQSVRKIVIGRPVIFSEDQDLDTLAEGRLRLAAERAGFDDVSFQLEPVAAAAACTHQLDYIKEKIILIGDLGGGTSDFAVVKINPRIFSGGKINEVLSVSGVHIGGNDFDSQIMWEKMTKYFGRFAKIRSMKDMTYGGNTGLTMPSAIMRNLCQWHKIPQLKTPQMKRKIAEYKYLVEPQNKILIENLENLLDDNYGYMLFQAIEFAKMTLSSTDVTHIFFKERNLFIDEILSRFDFESMLYDFIEKIKISINKALDDAGIKNTDVDIVSLAGGSSLLPSIRNIFSSRFGENKIIQNDVFTNVAFGLGLFP